MTEPTFLVGLALQLPFALGAVLLAYAVHALGLGFGRSVARTLALRRPIPATPLASLGPLPSATLIVPSVLAAGHGSRAPPPVCR